MTTPIVPWSPYGSGITLASHGRASLVAAFSDLVQVYAGFSPCDLQGIFEAPADEDDNDAARHLVQLDAEMLCRRFVKGDIDTFARPFHGGEVEQLAPDLWEIDDPLARFATGCFNREHWADPHTELTHRLFVDSTQFDRWLAGLKPPGVLPDREVEACVNPQVRAARATAARTLASSAPLTSKPSANASGQPASGVGPELLKLEVVMAMVSLSASSIYQKAKDGHFPQQVKLGGASRWYRHEVEQWIAEQAALRGV